MASILGISNKNKPYACLEPYSITNNDGSIPTDPWDSGRIEYPSPQFCYTEYTLTAPDGKGWLTGTFPGICAGGDVEPIVALMGSTHRDLGFWVSVGQENAPLIRKPNDWADPDSDYYKNGSQTGFTGWQSVAFQDYEYNNEYRGEFSVSFNQTTCLWEINNSGEARTTFRWEPGYTPGSGETLPDTIEWRPSDSGYNIEGIGSYWNKITSSELIAASEFTVNKLIDDATSTGVAASIKADGLKDAAVGFDMLNSPTLDTMNGFSRDVDFVEKVRSRIRVYGLSPGSYEVDVIQLSRSATRNASNSIVYGPLVREPDIIYPVTVTDLTTSAYSDEVIIQSQVNKWLFIGIIPTSTGGGYEVYPGSPLSNNQVSPLRVRRV